MVTALFGAVLAYPTVRVRGVYLAVITIAFGLVFQNILVEWLPVTGGTQGLIGIPRGNLFGIELRRPVYYWVVAGCLVVAFIVQYNIIHSRYGRAMRATAQSENASKALGINLAGIRTLAFVVSATLAGLAGGLYTFLNLFVNYETFTFFHSVSFLLMVILGGTGTLLGPVSAPRSWSTSPRSCRTCRNGKSSPTACSSPWSCSSCRAASSGRRASSTHG